MNFDYGSYLMGLASTWVIYIAVDYYFSHRNRVATKVEIVPNVPTRDIEKLVAKLYPDWSWDWTTVGADGRPQILLRKFYSNGGMKEWKIIEQVFIEKESGKN